MLAEVLALLQRETGELWGGGLAEAPGEGISPEHIPTMPDVCC